MSDDVRRIVMGRIPIDENRQNLVTAICTRYAALFHTASGRQMSEMMIARAMATLYFAKDGGTDDLIDLEAMFAESDVDLMFDFTGSVAYFNPKSRTFTHKFVPRCGFKKSKQAPAG